jgi:hypothetical protein
MRKLCKTLCLLLFLFSCSTDDFTENKVANENCISDIQLIFEAQTFFEKAVINSVDTIIQKGNNKEEPRKKNKKNLQWDKAFIRELSFGTGVVVPLTYEKELYIRKANSSIALSDLSYMLFYVDYNGKMQAELVTALPDETYTTSDNENQAFSGVVLVEDWHGNYLKGFMHKENQVTPVNLSDIDYKIEQIEICNVTDYYYCESSDNWITEKCRYMYTSSSCFTLGSGGGGSADPDYPPINDDDTFTKRELTPDEKNKLIIAKKDLMRYCPNQLIINTVWNNLSFKIDPSIGGPAGFDHLSNTIFFRDMASIAGINIVEEIFHAYQNSFYSGGIGQYWKKPGETNIEFEAKFYKDFMEFLKDGVTAYSASQDFSFSEMSDYISLLFNLRESGFTSGVLNQYYTCLEYFLKRSGYNGGVLDKLKDPNAFIKTRMNCN